MKQEQRWIKQIKRNGSHKAANQLISTYYREMYAFVYKQTLDAELSQDLTQEIFISVLKSIGRFDDKKASFRTWLYRIASNRLVDYYRSKSYQDTKRVEMLEEDDHYVDPHDVALALEYKEDVESVNTVIKELTANVQQVIRLKLFGDYTLQEIAEMVQVPVSTVKTRYYKAMRLIKQEMEGQRDE